MRPEQQSEDRKRIDGEYLRAAALNRGLDGDVSNL